jgi:hypothetical protein
MVGNQNCVPTRMSHGALNLEGSLHDLLKFLEKLLPRFNLHKSCTSEDHINIFYLYVSLMAFEYEDAVWIIFPYTFENNASTWNYNFLAISIGSWHAFERDYLNKFEEEKYVATLLWELITIIIEKKEKLKILTNDSQPFLINLMLIPNLSKYCW